MTTLYNVLNILPFCCRNLVAIGTYLFIHISMMIYSIRFILKDIIVSDSEAYFTTRTGKV